MTYRLVTKHDAAPRTSQKLRQGRAMKCHKLYVSPQDHETAQQSRSEKDFEYVVRQNNVADERHTTNNEWIPRNKNKNNRGAGNDHKKGIVETHPRWQIRLINLITPANNGRS